MPKLATQLTILKIKNSKPKNKPYFLSDGDNLLLKIDKNGIKTFYYQFTDKDGKRKRISIGKFDEVSLLEAREIKNQLKSKLKNGDIVTTEKINFKTIYEKWINKQIGLSQKHQATIKSYFNRFFLPNFQHLELKEISRKDIINILDPLINENKKETIYRMLGILSQFYKFAILHEYTDHNIISDIDKKTLIGKREVKHFAYLKDENEIRTVLKAIKSYFGDERLKVCAIFQLYTAVRGQNARFARWQDIDFKNKIWKIPAEQMKMRKPHEVFLSDSVISLLKKYQNQTTYSSDLIFPSIKTNIKPISDNSVRSMLRNLGFNNDMITPHGFRATFSTIAHEKRDEHGQSSDVIELCLAHTELNKIKDAYNHAKNLKARQILMQWWSDYLDKLQE